MLERLYQRLSYPLGVEKPSKELKEAIKILDWDLMAWQVISASTIFMLISTLIVAPVFAYLISHGSYISSLIILSAPILVFVLLTEYPKYLAKAKLSKEIGEIPIFLSELSILLQQNPNIEKAIEILSNFEGSLFKKLRNYFVDLKLGEFKEGKEILLKLSSEYDNIFPEFKRALVLILNNEFERGIKLCLNGVSNKIEEFTNKLTIPTLIIFSVGAILPLIFISLLPALSFIGVDALTLLLVITISLLFIFVYSNVILSRRPIVFPHVDLNERSNHNILWYVLISIAVSTPSILYLLKYIGISVKLFPVGYNLIWILFGVTIGISLYSFNYSKDLMQIRNHLEKRELDVPNLSYKLSNLAVEGKPIDEEILKMKFDTHRLKLLHYLILNSISKGSRYLYSLLVTFGDYFSKIDSIKQSFFNKIDNIIEMMKLTIILFLPLVSAISVSIAISLSKYDQSPFFSFSVDPELIVFISGMYTMLTSIFLLRYIVYLKNGNDIVELHNTISKYLPLSIGLFVILYSLLPEVIF